MDVETEGDVLQLYETDKSIPIGSENVIETML